jgi:retrograde regulation protein 2
MNISDFEDLGIISDFEEDEETNDAAKGALMTPALPAASHGDGEKPHPPWQGHRDKLVGVVDMGRRVTSGIPEFLYAD